MQYWKERIRVKRNVKGKNELTDLLFVEIFVYGLI